MKPSHVALALIGASALPLLPGCGGSVTASARGPGNPAGANADVPATWSTTRTRPLCAYPKVARYQGSGSIESADSFSCQ